MHYYSDLGGGNGNGVIPHETARFAPPLMSVRSFVRLRRQEREREREADGRGRGRKPPGNYLRNRFRSVARLCAPDLRPSLPFLLIVSSIPSR